jgi:cell division transport system ATP-binding protein
VAQNIAMAMEVSYQNTKAIKKRVSALLQKLRLEHKHDTLAEKLSRGEQQRVAIARSMANSPALILADEPTGNLDSRTTRLVMDLFKLCNTAGATVIIATHDEAIYKNSSYRVLELQGGRILDQAERSISTHDTMP